MMSALVQMFIYETQARPRSSSKASCSPALCSWICRSRTSTWGEPFIQTKNLCMTSLCCDTLQQAGVLIPYTVAKGICEAVLDCRLGQCRLHISGTPDPGDTLQTSRGACMEGTGAGALNSADEQLGHHIIPPASLPH